jgi:hypothetical protein
MSDDDLDAIRARIRPEQRALAREMMKHVHPAYGLQHGLAQTGPTTAAGRVPRAGT